MGYGRMGWVMVAAMGVAVSGCTRMTTQVVDKPRVDQELQQGNQGYLKGSGPAPAPRKTTRKMIQTDIELPTLSEMNPWQRNRQPAAAAPAPTPAPVSEPAWEPSAPAQEQFEPAPVEPEPEPAPAQTYKVQKGDTLEKISKKFYGTTQKWRTIYNANRDVLDSPDRLFAGQKLKIPALESYETPGGDYK